MQHRLVFWTHSPLAKSLVIVWGKRDLAQVTALCPSIGLQPAWIRLQTRVLSALTQMQSLPPNHPIWTWLNPSTHTLSITDRCLGTFFVPYKVMCQQFAFSLCFGTLMSALYIFNVPEKNIKYWPRPINNVSPNSPNSGLIDRRL